MGKDKLVKHLFIDKFLSSNRVFYKSVVPGALSPVPFYSSNRSMLVTFGSGQVESGALATWLHAELLSEGRTQLLLDQTSTQSTCFNILTILSDVKISCDSMLLFCQAVPTQWAIASYTTCISTSNLS